jgi:hypothetical protein
MIQNTVRQKNNFTKKKAGLRIIVRLILSIVYHSNIISIHFIY